MVNKCSYNNCKTGYEKKRDGINVAVKSTPVFKFPDRVEEPERFQLWARYVNRKEINEGELKCPYLCADHFIASDIIYSGTRASLKKDSIPQTEFDPNQSITILTPNKGEHLVDHYPKITKLDFREEVGNIDPHLEDDSNLYFETLPPEKIPFVDSHAALEFLKNLVEPKKWVLFKPSDQIAKFVYFDANNQNHQSSVVICLDLSIDINSFGPKSNISIFNKNGAIEMKNFVHIFSKKYVLRYESEAKELVEFIESNWLSFEDDKSTPSFEQIKKDFENCPDIDHDCPQVNWLKSQMHHINKKGCARRYSNSEYMTAFNFYINGPKAYDSSRKFMFLPSIRQIRRLTQSLRPNPENDKSNIDYLKGQFKLLKPKEKYVFLKIDEVSLIPSLDFQGEQVMGYASNSKNGALADSCQAFMICSMLSKFQEIVKLNPVKNQTAPQLKKSLMEILKLLHEIGFVVLAVTSDNHACNRKMIYEVCGGETGKGKKDEHHNFFKFKYNESHIIHFFFDAPHLIKCIRNNWYNLTNIGKKFIFPDHSEIPGFQASFEVICRLFESEENNLVKFAYRLNKAVINPGTWGKQNVRNALSIFHDTTSAGLEAFVENDKSGDALSTARFCNLIESIWKFLNIKTPFKGMHKNDPDSKPFMSSSDERLHKVQSVIDWLYAWESKNFISDGKLSEFTFHSLIITLKSLKSFVCHIFDDPSSLGISDDIVVKYVLTGKFQTDILEKRFGKYRQLNGSIYAMTFIQLCMAEKKLRIKSKLKLGGFKHDIVIKEDDDDYDEIFQVKEGDLYFDVIEFLNDPETVLDFSEGDVMDSFGGVLFVAGAIAYKIKKRFCCSDCLKLLTDTDDSYEIETEENSLMETEEHFDNEKIFFNKVDRGRLLKPSVDLYTTVKVVLCFFELHIRPLFGIKVKNPSSAQLRNIINTFITETNHKPVFESCGKCKVNDLQFEICRILSNIILNNFCKVVTDNAKKYVKDVGCGSVKKIKNQKQINICGPRSVDPKV